MGKNKLSSGLINVVTYDTDNNISLNSGSNLLMSLSGSGVVTIPGNLVVLGGIAGSNVESSSYSLNADKIDNLDSTQLVLTSSFNSYTSSISSSIGGLSGSVATTTSDLSSSIGSLSSSVATTTSGLAGRITTVEGNYATTGSNLFIGNQLITGSICSTGNIVTTGQIVAQTINVQQVTSSIVYSCGSNVFGCLITDTQQFTGSVSVTGSLIVNGAGTFSGVVTSGSPLSIKSTTPFIRWLNDSNTRLGYIQHNATNLVYNADTGVHVFNQAINGTSALFLSGNNQNDLGNGSLSLLSYAGYNNSANQNITLGLGLNEAVDSSKAYQYNLGVTGNASGQNLILTSKRRGTTDLTILCVDGTSGVATFTGTLNGTNASFKVSSDRNLAIKYDTNITISGQADSGGPESLRMYADTFRIYTATSAAGLTERFAISNTGGATFSCGVQAVNDTNNSATFSSRWNASGYWSQLEVRNYSSNLNNQNSPQFRIMHNFNDEVSNGYIGFHRGSNLNGGFLSFGTNGAEQMRITTGGNVGVGTCTPTYKLDVLGESGNIISDTSNGTLINIDGGSITSTNFGVGIGFVRTGSQMAFIKAARENTSDEAGFLSFATQNAAGAHPESMRITSCGNILIGTTTQNGYLLRTADKGISCTNTYFGTGTVRIGGGADGGCNQVLSIAPGIVGVDAPGVGNGRFTVNGSGNVGINNPNPSRKLTVCGDFYTSGEQHNDSGYYYAQGSANLRKLVNVSDNTTTTLLTFNQNGSYSYIGGGEILIVFVDPGSPWGVYVWKGLITIRTVQFGSLYSTGLTEISNRNNLDGTFTVGLETSKDGGVANAIIRVVATTSSGIAGQAYVSFNGWVTGGSQPV
jgi:hypothetical protein